MKNARAKPIKFTELFHFSEPTNAKIKLNRNNTTFPAWDLLLHDDPEWEIMNAYRGGERNNNHKMNGREYLFAFGLRFQGFFGRSDAERAWNGFKSGK